MQAAFSASELRDLLAQLGALLADQAEPLALVIVGGAALNLAGTIARRTADVDVLAIGQGTRSDRGWSVVISKPMQATDADEASVGANLHASCDFAVWSGSRSDAGSRTSPSTEVHRLQFLP